jgi:hypothetical protein
MIVDHDAAADPVDFDCEEDPLRLEREAWVVSGCSGSSDCEGARDCWVGVSEGSWSASAASPSGCGFDLVSD